MQHRTSCLCIAPCQCASALAQGVPSPRLRAQINFAWPFRVSLCWHHTFLPTALAWQVLPRGCLSTGKPKLCTSADLRHSLSSISTETLFSSANIQRWFDFFFLSTWMLHPFFHPSGCSYPGHKRYTHWEKMKSFNRRDRQELLTYALISMYLLGLFKVLDYTIIFLLLLYKYTPIWWKILGHIQLYNSIYCCFEYIFTYGSAKKGCSEENKKAILEDLKRTKRESNIREVSKGTVHSYVFTVFMKLKFQCRF